MANRQVGDISGYIVDIERGSYECIFNKEIFINKKRIRHTKKSR